MESPSSAPTCRPWTEPHGQPRSRHRPAHHREHPRFEPEAKQQNKVLKVAEEAPEHNRSVQKLMAKPKPSELKHELRQISGRRRSVQTQPRNSDNMGESLVKDEKKIESAVLEGQAHNVMQSTRNLVKAEKAAGIILNKNKQEPTPVHKKKVFSKAEIHSGRLSEMAPPVDQVVVDKMLGGVFSALKENPTYAAINHELKDTIATVPRLYEKGLRKAGYGTGRALGNDIKSIVTANTDASAQENVLSKKVKTRSKEFIKAKRKLIDVIPTNI